MKFTKVTFIAVALLHTVNGHATSQWPDSLVYKSQKGVVVDSPFEPIRKKMKLKFKPPGRFNYRGYICSWEIKNDKLYLTKISGELASSKTEDKVDLQQLFPKASDSVMADWFTGKLYFHSGKCIFSDRTGLVMAYEVLTVFDIAKGKVLKERKYRFPKNVDIINKRASEKLSRRVDLEAESLWHDLDDDDNRIARKALNTEQLSDSLLEKGQKGQIDEYPFEPVLETKKLVFKPVVCSNYRGYFCIWTIKDGKLLLTKIFRAVKGKTDLKPKEISKKKYFPNASGDVLADWFTGKLHVHTGSLKVMTYPGFIRAHEKLTVFEIVKGRVVKQKVHTFPKNIDIINKRASEEYDRKVDILKENLYDEQDDDGADAPNQ